MSECSVLLAAAEEGPSYYASVLAAAYPHVGGIMGAMVRWRPYICPFQELFADVPFGASVLDVGCGTGVAGVLLAHVRKATVIIGVDTSARAIRIARKAVVPDHTSATFRQLSLADPWPTDEVSTVVCLDVLHHVPKLQQREFIRRLARLNFSDRIVFKDVSPHGVNAIWSHVHDLLIARERISIRCEHEVARWFEEEGLRVRGPRRLDSLWYTHYGLVAERIR